MLPLHNCPNSINWIPEHAKKQIYKHVFTIFLNVPYNRSILNLISLYIRFLHIQDYLEKRRSSSSKIMTSSEN